MSESSNSWIGKAEAQRMLGCGQRVMTKLVAEGRFTLRQLPGSAPMLLRKDVEAMVATCTIAKSH